MKKQLNTAIAALFLATASMIATATEVGGTYVATGMVKVSTDALDVLAGVGITIDDSDNAVTFGIGYQIDKNLSFEASIGKPSVYSATYTSNGTGTIGGKSFTSSVDAIIEAEMDTSYTLGMKYSQPINNKFKLHGGAGVLFWDVNVTGKSSVELIYNGVTYSDSQEVLLYQNDGSDLYYGVGGSYELVKGASVNVDYLKMEVDDADLDGVSLAVVFDI